MKRPPPFSALRTNLSVAWDTLRARKARSALTILGIVIGVTSVISVAAIIEGLNGYIQEKVASFGPRSMFIGRFPAGTNPQQLPERLRTRKYLHVDDAEFIRRTCPNVEMATGFLTRATFFGDTNEIRYRDQSVDKVVLRGAEPEYAIVLPMFSVDFGRFISRYDEDHARPVVVLGAAIADSLFPSVDPLGREVNINGKGYEVIGVFSRDPGLFGIGGGVDVFAITPLSEFRKRYPEAKEAFLTFMAMKDADLSIAKDEVTNAMRRLRRVRNEAPDDFEISSPDFLSTLWNQLTGAVVLLTSVISSIGLLVGGVGVMNIMLISVTERTQEIGIRKAVGARKLDIRVQFLVEAIVLTLTGGIIGILLGAVVAFAVRTLIPSIPATLSYLWVALGVLMSVGVGLFFGYYPANRAANLDPIVCLRYE